MFKKLLEQNLIQIKVSEKIILKSRAQWKVASYFDSNIYLNGAQTLIL